MKNDEDLESRLRETWRREPPPQNCPSEERWLAFAAGEASAVEEENLREHLAGCSRCVEIARDATTFAKAMKEGVGNEAAARGSSLPAWALALAASIVLALAGILLTRSGQRAVPTPVPDAGTASVSPSLPANPWRDLKIPLPSYTPPSSAADDLVFRSDQAVAPPGPGAFEHAMEPYAVGDFHLVERKLGEFLEEHPEHAEARLFRGAALARLGRTGEAVEEFGKALEGCAARVCDEARWHRALSRLKLGRFEQAQQDLREAADSPGDRRAAAGQLLADVSAHLERTR